MLVKVDGITRCLWRAIDQDGNVSDVLVRSRRNAKRHLLSAIDSRTEMADRFAVGYEVTVLDAAA
ncbi:DDE domain protein [Mycobacterium ulcerans str. Harvey]|uniref:DDE domain protein n=1 Tax=Mycobacterium ulcerans str. Harvey TaxID=1299332 RepID=A0ABN0QKX7_MYCUL|nr:DDE domain protein [Mycobacterium ulcerans str. Harvey]